MPSGATALATPHIFIDRREKILSVERGLRGANQSSHVFGHLTLLDRFDADSLQRFGKRSDRRRVVEFAAVREASRPREDRGNRIG